MARTSFRFAWLALAGGLIVAAPAIQAGQGGPVAGRAGKESL